jgi:hypothetical protein
MQGRSIDFGTRVESKVDVRMVAIDKDDPTIISDLHNIVAFSALAYLQRDGSKIVTSG